MKPFLLLSFILLSVAFSSCRKERSCECTITTTTVHTTGSFSTSNTDVYTTKVTDEKQRKKYFRVNNQCYSATSTDTKVQGNSTTITTEDSSCDIK